MEMKSIYSAFVKAQKSFAPALKTSTNPHFKSRYADLAACVEAVIDSLNTNGIGLVQKTHTDDTGVTVETLFLHESGESFSGGLLHVPAAKHDPQGFGSALSYARRYSLMAACGIAPEDDDGNAASKPAKNPDAAFLEKQRAAWLETQRIAIMGSTSTGALRMLLGDSIDVAMQQNDSAAVDQLNAWADEKRAQAKPKVAA